MPSNRLEILVKNIEKILHEKARKPSWLADEAKVSRATVSRVLAGEMNPSLDVVDALAHALGVPLSRLVADPNDLLENFYTFDEVFEEKMKAIPETQATIARKLYGIEYGLVKISRQIEQQKDGPSVDPERQELLRLILSIDKALIPRAELAIKRLMDAESAANENQVRPSRKND